jgi:hypothetical protein
MNYLELLLLWPLIVVIEDCFVPESARDLLPAVAALDDESARVTLTLWAMDAKDELGKVSN